VLELIIVNLWGKVTDFQKKYQTFPEKNLRQMRKKQNTRKMTAHNEWVAIGF